MNIGPEVSVAGMEAWDAAHKAGVRDWPTMLETVYLAMRAKDAAVAELIEAGKALLAGSVAQATAADHADMPAEDKADAEFRASVARDAMRAALARVGGSA